MATDALEPPRRRGDLLRGALLVALFALAYLARPIAGLLDGAYFSPADISQRFELTAVEPEHVPGNALMSDVWVQMHAWAIHGAHEIGAGRFPLWNSRNGGGVPHFASYQTALLSPFTWPAYVLELRTALVVAAFLKLFALGFCAFAFLRELRLSFGACALGAAVHQFGGHNLLLLSYPHSGVAVLLPAGLYFVERIARSFEAAVSRERAAEGSGERMARTAPHATSTGASSDPAHERSSERRGWGARANDTSSRNGSTASPRGAWRARQPGLLAALAVSCGLAALAGHPETLYFCALFVALYAVARAIGLARDSRDVAGARRELAITIVQAVIAVGLGFGLASIQLVPFVEYLRESAIFFERNRAQTPLPLENWPLLFFPDALGNPTDGSLIRDDLPAPIYEIANLAYVGPFTLVLAACALVTARTRRATWFFGASALAWFLYAHDVLAFGRLVQLVPTLDLAPPNRSQAIWVSCCAVLAALGLDALSSRARGTSARLAAPATLVLGALVMLAALAGAQRLLDEALSSVGDARAQAGARLVLAASQQFAWCALGFTALAFARSLPRAVVAGLALASVLGSTAFLWRSYHPMCEERFFFPRTAHVETLKRSIGDASVLVFGPDLLPPATNLVYGVREPQTYDALGVKRYDALYDEMLDKRDNWRTVDFASSRALDVFGIEYVAGLRGWIEVDTSFPDDPASAQVVESEPVAAGRDVVQDFVGVANGLDRVLVRFARGAAGDPCGFVIALEDPSSGEVLARRELSTDELELGFDGRWRATLDVPAIGDSKGRALRLRIATSETEPASAPRVLVRQDAEVAIGTAIARAAGTSYKPKSPPAELARWKLARGDEPLAGMAWIDLAHATRALDKVADLGVLELFRRERAAGRFHTVGRAFAASSDREAYLRTCFQPFDPLREVVCVAASGEATAAKSAGERAATEPIAVGEHDATLAPVTIVEDSGERVVLETDRSTPGWLVAAIAHFPGWRARVDGADAPLLRANYAFTAVAVPAGRARVELVYEPASFEIGRLASLACALVLAGWLGASRRVRASA